MTTNQKLYQFSVKTVHVLCKQSRSNDPVPVGERKAPQGLDDRDYQ